MIYLRPWPVYVPAPIKYHCDWCKRTDFTFSDFKKKNQMKYLKTCKGCREQRMQYKIDNRESINTKAREQYQVNKVKIIETQKTFRANNIEKLQRKIECDCGGCYQYMRQAEHRRTKKHIKHLESLS